MREQSQTHKHHGRSPGKVSHYLSCSQDNFRILCVSVLGDNDHGIKYEEELEIEKRRERSNWHRSPNFYYPYEDDLYEDEDQSDPEVIVESRYFDLSSIPALLEAKYVHVSF